MPFPSNLLILSTTPFSVFEDPWLLILDLYYYINMVKTPIKLSIDFWLPPRVLQELFPRLGPEPLLLSLMSPNQNQLPQGTFSGNTKCRVESLCFRETWGFWLQLEMVQFGKQLLYPNSRIVHTTNRLLHLQSCPYLKPEAS